MIRRLWFDVTDTRLKGVRGGIGRVVGRFAQAFLQANAIDGVETLCVARVGRTWRRVHHPLTGAFPASPRHHPPAPTATPSASRAPSPEPGLTNRLAYALREHWHGRGLPHLTPAPGDALVLLDGHWRPELWPAALAFQRLGGSLIPGVHDLIALDHPDTCDPLTAARLRAWLSRAAQHADAFACVSRATADRLQNHLDSTRTKPAGPRPILVTPPGCDPPTSAPSAPRPQTSVAPKRLLIVGALEPRKNHAVLCDACEHLWDEGHDLQLTVVGRPGWRCDAITDRLQSLLHAGRPLRWLQDADDAALENAYASADALVIPSLDEGFGLPAVEALTRGLSVIASDIPALREATQGRARFLPPQDTAAWIDALRQPVSPVQGFTWPTWDQAAADLVRSVHSAFDQQGG